MEKSKEERDREWHRASAREGVTLGVLGSVMAVLGVLVDGDPFPVALVSCQSVVCFYYAWGHWTRSRSP